MSFTSDELRKLIAENEEALREPGTVLFSQTRYEIQRILGEGGMGITCLANEIGAANLKRPVVLKFVKDSLDPQRLTQFLNEVQLSILFNHPNLVPIFRLETEVMHIEAPKATVKERRRRPYEHTVYYAVMQYIDGWNLRQIVDRLRNLRILLNYDMAMFIIGRVARGLHYVHNYRDENKIHLGLVHRDVSPENILIDRFARIKVADFGIARAMKRALDDSMLRAGNLLYCSPEQLEGSDLNCRSDIYNIGLLMYFLFTNTDRFGLERGLLHPKERIRKKMGENVLDDLHHVDERLRIMCEVCLREDPAERYQNCEDLANDIDIYFKDNNRLVTNEQLEEILNDVFTASPTFVSRRFIPLTGSAVLRQPGFDPKMFAQVPAGLAHMRTVKMDNLDDED